MKYILIVPMPLRKIPISYQIMEKAPGACACFLKGFLRILFLITALDFVCYFWYRYCYFGTGMLLVQVHKGCANELKQCLLL